MQLFFPKKLKNVTEKSVKKGKSLNLSKNFKFYFLFKIC